ncbi:cytochrome bd-I oxidase subunit CydX [Moraxella marmotae]
MWYFAWILGLGFAVLLAILSAVWVEFESSRQASFGDADNVNNTDD